MELIETGLEIVELAQVATDLPERPDYDFADELVKSFYRSQIISDG